MKVYGILVSAGVAFATLAPLMSVRAENFTFISPAGAWDGKNLKKDEIAASFSKCIPNRKCVSGVEMLVTAIRTFSFAAAIRSSSILGRMPLPCLKLLLPPQKVPC